MLKQSSILRRHFLRWLFRSSKKYYLTSYIEVNVGHYLLFRPPKISYSTVWGIKNICLHTLSVFYLNQQSKVFFIIKKIFNSNDHVSDKGVIAQKSLNAIKKELNIFIITFFPISFFFFFGGEVCGGWDRDRNLLWCSYVLVVPWYLLI